MQIELDYPPAVPATLDPSKTLLIIVDMENDSCHPSAAGYNDRMKRCVEANAQLRKRVRAAGGKVMHTQSVRKPDCLEFTLFKNRVRKLEGSWDAAHCDELKPAADEPVIVKYTHDCFHETEMDALLLRLGMKPGEGRIIVTGTATRCCVLHAVMGLSVRDYYVYVPMDCTTQKEERDILQAFSLFTGFGYKYNVTMTNSDVISFAPAKVLAKA
jgi:nicotinamidase-related amidase